MRLADREQDFWELRSGEESARQHPQSFWIPPSEERRNLDPGQGVKLMFDIETADPETGEIIINGERMWVIVKEKHDDVYLGILDNQPACVEPSERAYLVKGAEIPFRAEHVIDILDFPSDYARERMAEEPSRRWLPWER